MSYLNRAGATSSSKDLLVSCLVSFMPAGATSNSENSYLFSSLIDTLTIFRIFITHQLLLSQSLIQMEIE